MYTEQSNGDESIGWCLFMGFCCWAEAAEGPVLRGDSVVSNSHENNFLLIVIMRCHRFGSVQFGSTRLGSACIIVVMIIIKPTDDGITYDSLLAAAALFDCKPLGRGSSADAWRAPWNMRSFISFVSLSTGELGASNETEKGVVRSFARSPTFPWL